MMDLESAIQHCEEVAIREKSAADGCRYWTDGMGEETAKKCEKCADEHRQLAEWLKELKVYKENICGDAVSRQAVEEITWEESTFTDALNVLAEVRDKVRALPSVTPQQRTGRWIDAEVLDKIRTEIEEQKQERCFDDDDMLVYRTGLDDALCIIDKYKAESEDKE